MKFHNVCLALTIMLLMACLGCGHRRLPTRPIRGCVFYEGKSLTTGVVTFQPEVGPLAKGKIQSDGSFQLGTYGQNDGAIVGKHRVEIMARKEAVITPGSEPLPGPLLIPEKYTNAATSGIVVDVKPSQNDPVVIELTGPLSP